MGLNAPLTLFAFLATILGLAALARSVALANVQNELVVLANDAIRRADDEDGTELRLHSSRDRSRVKILNALTYDVYALKRTATMQNIRKRRQVGPQSQQVAAAGFSALRCRLYCQNGFYLQSHLDGSINGTRESASKFAILEMLRVAVKLVSIRGLEGGNYICMNRKGKMYGSRRRNAECVFIEEYLDTKTFVYSSKKFSKRKRQYFIGISRKGRGRRGKKRKQRSVQFNILPIADSESFESASHRFSSSSFSSSSSSVSHFEGPFDLTHIEDNPNLAGDNEPPDLTADTVETQELE